MRQWFPTALTFWLTLVWFATRSNAQEGETVPVGLAARAWSIADAVVTHHLEPPARQQMLLSGIRAVLDRAQEPNPFGLAKRVSDLETPEQLATLLVEVWPKVLPPDVPKPVPFGSDPNHRSRIEGEVKPGLETSFLEGLLDSIPGEVVLTLAKDARVSESMQANLYVGVQISLSYDESLKAGVVGQVLEGGPAFKAGLLTGDLIEAIDGGSAIGLTIRQIVDRLRGPIGTEVVVRVRRDKKPDPITVSMTRAILPRRTIQSVEKLPGTGTVGLIKVVEILGSTPQEIRAMARRVEAEGYKALVLDLQSTSGESLHATVLLADALLDGGTIGRVRSSEAERTYTAELDALFRGFPLAVIVGNRTSSTARWLAAALEDNGRAKVFGDLSSRDVPEVASTVSLADGEWAIRLNSGRLLRGNGQPMPVLNARALAARNRYRDEDLKKVAEESKLTYQLPADPVATRKVEETSRNLLDQVRNYLEQALTKPAQP